MTATPDAAPARHSDAKSGSYGQILKSTLAIGGASLANVAFGMVRAKAMAMLLGPAGVGLFGVFNSILDLAQGVAGFGVASSGVRSVAQASERGDAAKIARSAAAIRLVSMLLAIAGAVVLAAASGLVSQASFSSGSQAGAVALLALALFFRVIAAGQVALIQGMRQVALLARATVWSGLAATIATILIVALLGERGVALALVVGAFLSILPTWRYARRLVPDRRWRSLAPEAKELLKLGFAFMVSGLLAFGTAYLVRILLVRHFGFEAAGLFQAAWALGGLYTGIVLQAMGTDFFPRLASAFEDDALTNRLVNEQARVSLALAGPGVAATLALAPVVVTIFYSGAFAPAAAVLRWICLGMMLRIVAWPLGYIVLARSLRGIFIATEIAATAVHLGLVWLLIGPFGMEGAGIAFFLLYAWHSVLIFVVVRHVSGFGWSRENRRLGAFFLGSVGAVFVACLALPPWPATAFGLLATAIMSLHSLRLLAPMVRDLGWLSERVLAPLRVLRPRRIASTS